jgi:uncharacterized protein YicC (UPF0701 family)
VEHKGATLKKHATRTVNAVAQRISAIENACSQTVQSLTARLTEQCRAFSDTLEGFSNQLNTQEILVESIKNQDQQWAQNHFTLKAVVEKLTLQTGTIEAL